MRIYQSLFGPVELTDERKEHILFFHPDVRSYFNHFQKALLQPGILRRSKHDPKVILFYTKIRKDKYLAVTVKTNHRFFVLTAHFTSRVQHNPFL